MGIVDVHLATEGFDVDFAGSVHAAQIRTDWLVYPAMAALVPVIYSFEIIGYLRRETS
jgi:hypothetical protein